MMDKPAKKKVLVVDDEIVIRRLVRQILSQDYEVLEASDGEQAVVLAQEHKPDVILMDMMMPKKDGLSACADIRANPETSNIPIIMVTALDYERGFKVADVFGVNKYITKPFKTQDLLDAVNQYAKSIAVPPITVTYPPPPKKNLSRLLY